MSCSIPLWSTASLRELLPHLCQGYGAGDAGQDSTLNLKQGNESVLFGKAITNIWVCCCHKQPCTHSAHSVSKSKILSWDVYSGMKKESDHFPAARLKVLKWWSNTAWDFFLAVSYCRHLLNPTIVGLSFKIPSHYSSTLPLWKFLNEVFLMKTFTSGFQ